MSMSLLADNVKCLICFPSFFSWFPSNFVLSLLVGGADRFLWLSHLPLPITLFLSCLGGGNERNSTELRCL